MIKITHNLDQAIKQLDGIARQRIPKAAVRAMNQCSFTAQQQLKQNFGSQFHSRSRWLVNQIVYRGANLSQWPYLRARVGSKYKAMSYQDMGGTKEATQPIWLGVPMRDLKSSESETRYRRMPQDLLKKNGYEIIKAAKGYLLVYKQPMRRGRKGSKRKQVVVQPSAKMRVLYGLHQQTQFRPRWQLGAQVWAVFCKQFERRFKSNMG